jgi:hypothetical protein
MSIPTLLSLDQKVFLWPRKILLFVSAPKVIEVAYGWLDACEGDQQTLLVFFIQIILVVSRKQLKQFVCRFHGPKPQRKYLRKNYFCIEINLKILA